MSVYFRFRSHSEVERIPLDDMQYISVAELRRTITKLKKIKSDDCYLQIMKANTKEVYEDDSALIPKNTAVTVARVPVASGSRKIRGSGSESTSSSHVNSQGSVRYDKISKDADLVNSKMSEDDKLKAMIDQSGADYDPSKYKKVRNAKGMVPLWYICKRCGKGGHWINNCTETIVKRSTGIPRSFMIPVDGPEHKGALLTSSGVYAVPKIELQAYKEVKKEKPPFVPGSNPSPEPESKAPDELLCMICKEVVKDAVVTPCCGNAFCDECVREALLESDDHACPACQEKNVSPNNLVPNLLLRKIVAKGDYARVIRKNSGASLHSQERKSSTSSDSSTEVDRINSGESLHSHERNPSTSSDSPASAIHQEDMIAVQVPADSRAETSPANVPAHLPPSMYCVPSMPVLSSTLIAPMQFNPSSSAANCYPVQTIPSVIHPSLMPSSCESYPYGYDMRHFRDPLKEDNRDDRNTDDALESAFWDLVDRNRSRNRPLHSRSSRYRSSFSPSRTRSRHSSRSRSRSREDHSSKRRCRSRNYSSRFHSSAEHSSSSYDTSPATDSHGDRREYCRSRRRHGDSDTTRRRHHDCKHHSSSRRDKENRKYRH